MQHMRSNVSKRNVAAKSFAVASGKEIPLWFVSEEFFHQKRLRPTLQPTQKSHAFEEVSH